MQLLTKLTINYRATAVAVIWIWLIHETYSWAAWREGRTLAASSVGSGLLLQ